MAALELGLALIPPAGYVLFVCPSLELLSSGLTPLVPVLVFSPAIQRVIGPYQVYNGSPAAIEVPAGALLAQAWCLPVEAPVLVRDEALAKLLAPPPAQPETNEFVIADIWGSTRQR